MRIGWSRLLLAGGGAVFAVLALEVAVRLWAPEEMPLNNPYQFTRLVGERRHGVPLHSYREIYPLQFDRDGYYRRTDGAVDYHFDQCGGRWIAAQPRDLDGDVAVVVGDSFTLGFGLRYEDVYVFLAEQALRGHDRRRHFVNFAEPGADAQIDLKKYLTVRDAQPHDLLLYGLHLNDLIRFPTSAVAMAGWRASDAGTGSHLLAFVYRTIARRGERESVIAKLTDTAQMQRPKFRDNMVAIEAMQREAAAHGRRFAVVLLPILVDLQAGTFEPVYAAIRRALAERGILVIDLSRSLDGRDSDFWILPFDQHPNARAHAVFAHELTAALSDSGPVNRADTRRTP